MRTTLIRVCSLIVILLLIGLPAAAGSLSSAKAAGQVGEKPDGYVGLVDEGAPAEIRELVQDINARRRVKYEEIAKKSGAAVNAVAARAGTKLIERAAEGNFVMDASGKWVRK
jgi:uncharacterized protein YdbL (DUF1318 family)